jgi:hypothetical protein
VGGLTGLSQIDLMLIISPHHAIGMTIVIQNVAIQRDFAIKDFTPECFEYAVDIPISIHTTEGLGV